MEFKEIDELLEKYFEGVSSLEDEAKISHFLLQSQELPEMYSRLKAVFSLYQSEKNKTSKLQFSTIAPKKAKIITIRRIVYFAVAACIALFIGFRLINNKPDEKKVYAYINGKPVENKEIAYQEAQKALLIVSKNLNHGAQKVNHLSEFNKAIAIIGAE